jgi:hypothetical protein
MKDSNNQNNCEDFEILLDEFIDGEISASDREALEKHLSTCTSCKRDLEETLNLSKSVSYLSKEMAASPDIWKRIEHKISPQEKGTTKRSSNIFSINQKPRSQRSIYEQHTYSGRILKYSVITLIAAMILIAILPSFFRERGHQSTGFSYPFWPVIQLKGLTTVNSRIVNGRDSIKLGEWIETKDSGKAMLQIPGVGSIILEPNTKVKIVKTDTGEQRISLEYGTINANITTKPGTFIVDSRSAEAIDLGCAYTYSIDTGGNGLIYVKSGMVEMNHDGRKSLVPAGKFCITKTGFGPGTPYRENTSPELKDALLKYDFGNGGHESVNTILKHATKGDAITLLNLLPKVDEENRSKVYERVSHFVPPPKEYRYEYDSIPKMEYKDLHEWINKITKEVNEEIRTQMKDLQKEIQENIQNNMNENLGNIIDNEKLQKEIQENIQKHMEALQDLPQRIEIPNELMQKEMEKMQEKLNKFDSDKFDKEMEKLGEKMEKMGNYWEEQGRQWEFDERNQEREQEMEQRQQELQERQQERMQEMQERQQELEQRQQERQQELEQRLNEQDLERQKELQQQQMEREQELKQQEKEREKELKQQDKERQQELKKENQNYKQNEKNKDQDRDNNDDQDKD